MQKHQIKQLRFLKARFPVNLFYIEITTGMNLNKETWKKDTQQSVPTMRNNLAIWESAVMKGLKNKL